MKVVRPGGPTPRLILPVDVIVASTDGEEEYYIIRNRTLDIFVRRIQGRWRRRLQLKHRCATVIQRCFRSCNSNPYHPMCQRRLLREFTWLSKPRVL
jgi:hypothetical protein